MWSDDSTRPEKTRKFDENFRIYKEKKAKAKALEAAKAKAAESKAAEAKALEVKPVDVQYTWDTYVDVDKHLYRDQPVAAEPKTLETRAVEIETAEIETDEIETVEIDGEMKVVVVVAMKTEPKVLAMLNEIALKAKDRKPTNMISRHGRARVDGNTDNTGFNKMYQTNGGLSSSRFARGGASKFLPISQPFQNHITDQLYRKGQR